MPIEKIHFHEVGAVDAIVDIVGACVGFAALGIEKFACSALNVGGGTAKMAHGVLPVPAPATAKLLVGKPTYSNGVLKELVTPTGAAIVATLCDSFGPQPAMAVSAIGYGAGTTDLEGQPNVMRLMIGEAAQKNEWGDGRIIRVLEANLDDMNPQVYGYFLERALAAGALDVFATPVQMKKNRPRDADHGALQARGRGEISGDAVRGDHHIGRAEYTAQRRILASRMGETLTHDLAKCG